MNRQPTNEKPVDPAAALEVAEPIIRRYINCILRNRTHEFNQEDCDDAAQNVRVRLLEKIIPAYDASRGSLEAFLYRAITLAVTDEHRRMRAERRRIEANVTEDDVMDDNETPARDCGEADSMINDLLEHPRSYLSRIKSDLLKLALTTHTRLELANALGVTCDIAGKRMNRLMNDIRALV